MNSLRLLRLPQNSKHDYGDAEYQFAGAAADWRGESAFAVDRFGGAVQFLSLGGLCIFAH